MLVPDEVRKCVVFVGIQMAAGGPRLFGSAFFVGREQPNSTKADPVYAVTAKHVIDAVRRTGVDTVRLRVNLKNGSVGWIATQLKDWFSHPTDHSIDVAIIRMGIPEQVDHLVLPFSLCISEDKMREHEVALGDEVFITGLFRHHHGAHRNIPIVRVGNLACMTEERVSVRDFGEIDAYLIEARSTGGLSGSPVFLNLGFVRLIGKQIKHAAAGPVFLLMGLVHGHYDHQPSRDVSEDADGFGSDVSVERVNTGIAIVVPFHSIESVIACYEQSNIAS